MANSGDVQPATGPQIGPGLTHQAIPTPMAAGLPTPGGGTAYSGATISAAPTGPTQKEYITYETPSAPSIHPSRMAQMGASVSTPPVTGQTHARDEDEPVERPVFKRPKIEKLPYGQLYSVRLCQIAEQY